MENENLQKSDAEQKSKNNLSKNTIESKNATDEPEKLTGKQTFLQTVKYFLCAASAGGIQAGTFALFFEVAHLPEELCHVIALTLSVIWNFTLNRKFTFKSASNVPISMTLAFLFYVPFFPLSTWFVKWAPNTPSLVALGKWGGYIAEGIAMLVNGITEFLWQKFVVFGKTSDKLEKKWYENRKKRTFKISEKIKTYDNVKTESLSKIKNYKLKRLNYKNQKINNYLEKHNPNKKKCA